VAEVYTLLVDCSRFADDELPPAAVGARLLCYLGAESEAKAVEGVVQTLRAMGIPPLEVTSFGTLEERLAEGEVAAEELRLIERAAGEASILVGEMTPIFPETRP
jgi:hypothetical protein